MAEVTEQIIREAPDIEAYKTGLLKSARDLTEKDLNLPAFQAAGLSDVQQRAINLGQQGIGAYAPFLQAGQQAVEGGIGTLGAAGRAITDVNVAPQFEAAQSAMGLGLGAAGQMAPYVAQMGYGTNLIGEGAGLARGASAADLATAQGLLGESAGLTRGMSAADLAASQGILGQSARMTQGASAADLAAAQGMLGQATGMTRDFSTADLAAAQGMLGQAAGMTRGASAADLAAAQGLLGQAAYGTGGAMGAYDPRMAQAYMDPYQQQVTRNAIQEMLRTADIQQQGMAAKAAATGAFGGTREGVERAEFGRGLQDVMSRRIAEDMSRNYLQAQQASMGGFEQQQQRQLAGMGQISNIGQALAQQQLAQAGLGQQAAGQLSNIGQALAQQQLAQAGLGQQAAGQISNIGQALAQQQLAQAGLGQQAAGQMLNIGQTLGQQQLAQAGLGQQAAGQLANIGQTFGQQQLAQAGLGQQAAGLMGQLGTSLSGIYGQQAGLAGQQAGLYGNLGQGIGSLGAQYGQLGLQRGVALGDIGQALGAMGMNQAQLGELAQRANQGDVNALLTLGGLQQATEQARLDAFRATELQKETSPFQRLAFLSDIYKGAPSTQMSITGSTAPTTSPLLQAAGLGVSAVATAAGAKKTGLF